MLYLFPRDCPRVVVWPTSATSPEDRANWFGDRCCRAIAFIEEAWFDRVRLGAIYRCHMPLDAFEPIEDVGMWVSRIAVKPSGADRLDDLPRLIEEQDVELRVVSRLATLKGLWQTSLYASGIRLRNAQGR